VLVLCGPSERDIARRIAADSRSPHVFALSDTPLSLGLTKAVVRRLDVLVTTDSGPRHFAAAFGRPVVSLFGPTHIEWTQTYFDRETYLQKKVPCGPCQQRVCPLDHRCMRELSPAEVFAAADRLLNRHALPEARHAG
jgi:heptosyltransferase-2